MPDPNHMQQPEELALDVALVKAREAAGPLLEGEDFAGAMRAMAGLRAPVDAFFDKVTVNAPHPELRENRLRLLAQIRRTLNTVADLSRIEG
jgi:glycyl-tRNA synthetase beta chain